MAAPTTADVRVLDAPDHSRYEIRVGGELAGFDEYLDLVPSDLRGAFDLSGEI